MLARALALGAAVLMLLLGSPGPASAATEALCRVGDERLPELSGLAADGRRLYAVNDGGSSLEIFVLGRNCAVRRVISAPIDPYDIEDMALAPDGTFWLADTGDNGRRRDTIAVLKVSPTGRAVLYRLTYPDGRHDAEALLLDRAGVPHVVTKNVFGRSGVYRPARALSAPGPTPLKLVGKVVIADTETPGEPVGGAGSLLVTGGAVNADGTVIALRTYTDAYLYPVSDGNLATALGAEPVRVPLPGEGQGEAVAFEPDGTLLSASEGVGEQIHVVRGAADLVRPVLDGAAARDEEAGGTTPATWGLPTLPALGIAVAVAAALVLGVSRLARRK